MRTGERRPNVSLACVSSLLPLALALAGGCETAGAADGGKGGAAPQEGGAALPQGEKTDGAIAHGPIITPTVPGGPTDAALDSGDASEDDGSVPRDAGTDAGMPTCGNGRVERGEACDPGKDACCNTRCDGPLGSGAPCRAANGACDAAEVCDGTSVACPQDAVLTEGTVCRAANGVCDVSEVCDGVSKACPVDEVAPDTVVCGNTANGNCDLDDHCDGTGKACPDIVKASNVVCRASAGTCDPAENCDGTNKMCPATDAKSTAVCRPSGGACDPAEECDGVNDACPLPDVKSTAVCRPSQGVCDPAEACDGVSDDCPLDAKSTNNCRDSQGVCDPSEECDGVNDDCPPDLKSMSECRVDAGECDVAENCDGVNDDCPTDQFEAPDAPCGLPDATDCDAADTCDGNGLCIDRVDPDTAECRPKEDVCDVAEKCDGTNKPCPQPDAVEMAGVECRASTGVCDPAEVCDGSSKPCPPDAFERDGLGCYLPPAMTPNPTNGACSMGVCCPGATTHKGPGVCGPDPVFGPEANLVFVTSQHFPGAIFPPPSAPGAYPGIPSADAWCDFLAGKSNLGGTYHAWLSDSFFDVFFQISDGPYHRVDGPLVAPTKVALLDTATRPLQVPIEIVEMSLQSVTPVRTGTFPDGTKTPNHCMNWMSTVGQGDGGLSDQTGPQWTFLGSPFQCDTPLPFYCFQDDCPGQADVDFQNDPNNCGFCGNVCPGGTCASGQCAGRVFVTSLTYQGNLGGLAGADTICDMHAANANPPLPGKYTAWLSTFAAVDAKTRIIDQPYFRVDGAAVAGGVADLTDNSIANAINVHENNAASAAIEAWTNTWQNGTAVSSEDCQDWASSSMSDTSTIGNPQAITGAWSYDVGAGYLCSVARPIYCFQTGPVGVPIIITGP